MTAGRSPTGTCRPRPRGTSRAAAVALALALVGIAPGTTPAQTQPPRPAAARAAERAAQDLDAAIRALETARGATNRVAALTQVIRAHETGLSGLRDSLRAVDIRLGALESRLDRERVRISRLLGVMAGMERSSGPLILLHPAGPRGTALAGGVLSAITPTLQAEADALAAELADIKALRTVQQGAAETLARGLRSAQTARVALSRAAADRRDLPRRLTENPEALMSLVQSAETLDAFAGLLQDTRLPPDLDSHAFSQAKGNLPLPVQGRVLRGFEQAGPDGIKRPGLTVATRPRALVTLPWAATLRYMGPLLDYGNVIVAEPQDGYLLILTGLGEMFGEAGQILSGGAPLGLMNGPEPDVAQDPALPNATDASRLTQTLYIELREANTPIDPAPWFEQTKE